jgi:ABC-2 type transport system ATP-binding protein
MDEAMRFNRVVFMNRGRALLNGPPRELLGRLEGRVLELSAEPQAEARKVAAADPDVEDVQSFGDRLHLRVRDSVGPLARLPGALLGAGIRMTDLKVVGPTLEDVFIHLLETEGDGHGPDAGD